MTIIAEGNIALVTGGTSGIGLALVEQLCASCMKVFFCARNKEKIRRVEERLPDAVGIVCDVSDADQVQAMAQRIEQEAGRLDLLVAKVGMMENQDFAQAPLPVEDIKAQIDLNITAPALTVNAMLPLLRAAADAQIVLVGSGYGWSPNGNGPLYSAGKAAVRSFAKALRYQLASQQIAVLEVVPPMVDTPATEGKTGEKVSPEAVASDTLAGIASGKTEVFVGQTKAIPVMLRLAPGTLEKMTLKA